MHAFELIEPSWGLDILNWGIEVQTKYEWVSNLAPIFADIFVVLYPLFLLGVYLYAIIKKKPLFKQGAIYILISTVITVLINIGIQCFFYKERPIVVMNHVETEETLLHQILPSSSFPSDHAVVSMAVAMATLLWGLYSKKKIFLWSGIVFIVVSLIMTLCRILTLVHRPTDIIAGLLLGMFVPLILMIRPIRYVLIKYIINPIIRFEQWIIDSLFNYKQPEV